MTPAKATSCANKTGNSTSTSRYSILSDPRLSQLFALSSQLEALAQSIEVQPPSQPQQPPDLPPKPSSLINNNNSLQSSIKPNSSKDSSTHQPIPPPIPVKLNHSARGILGENQDLEKSSEVKYTRLQENPEDEENNDVPEDQGKHVILELHSVEILGLFCHTDFT